jgi:hypothetical protein
MKPASESPLPRLDSQLWQRHRRGIEFETPVDVFAGLDFLQRVRYQKAVLLSPSYFKPIQE